jgi:hypothetical protein
MAFAKRRLLAEEVLQGAAVGSEQLPEVFELTSPWGGAAHGIVGRIVTFEQIMVVIRHDVSLLYRTIALGTAQSLPSPVGESNDCHGPTHSSPAFRRQTNHLTQPVMGACPWLSSPQGSTFVRSSPGWQRNSPYGRPHPELIHSMVVGCQTTAACAVVSEYGRLATQGRKMAWISIAQRRPPDPAHLSHG